MSDVQIVFNAYCNNFYKSESTWLIGIMCGCSVWCMEGSVGDRADVVYVGIYVYTGFYG